MSQLNESLIAITFNELKVLELVVVVCYLTTNLAIGHIKTF